MLEAAGQIDALDELVDLNRWARNSDDEDNRQRIDQLLWDAFLADLSDAFGNSRRADEWALNCVILLDNAETTLGQRVRQPARPGMSPARR